MYEKWSEDLTTEQKALMKILGGFLADIPAIMDFMVKDMPERKAYLCKLAYLETLGKALKLDKENNNAGQV